MSNARGLTIRSTAGITPEQALAAIYSRAIERFEERQEGGPAIITTPDDAERRSSDSAPGSSIPR
jgi:hypothetical protein